MRVSIDTITVKSNRRATSPEHVMKLAESIAAIGLLNPITIDREHTLIAGLHRLEAVKSLNWTEIECTVSSLEGMAAELAEIDENLIRHDLSSVESGDLLLRRKEIYEALYPETRHGGDRKSEKIKSQKLRLDPAKSFVEDTAEKLDTSTRSIELQLQIAKNLTQEAKETIKEANYQISQKNALKLSRLPPEQQAEAAWMLSHGEIRSVDQYLKRSVAVSQPVKHEEGDQETSDGKSNQIEAYSSKEAADSDIETEAEVDAETETETEAEAEALSHSQKNRANADPQNHCLSRSKPAAPFQAGGKHFSSFQESTADLKDPEKDCRCTPDSFLEEITAFVRKFHSEIDWFQNPYYQVIFPFVTQAQLTYLRDQMNVICHAADFLYSAVERKANHEL